MLIKWLGLIQAVLLLGAIAAAIPALIQWEIWNGLDLLALILFFGFIASCYVEQKRDEDR